MLLAGLAYQPRQDPARSLASGSYCEVDDDAIAVLRAARGALTAVT